MEKLAGHKSNSPLPLDNMAMMFRTYKRDALLEDPFQNVKQFGTVNPAEMSVVIDGTTHLYESCPLTEVIRLLENPLGSVRPPISRRGLPLHQSEQTAKAFVLLLKEQLKAEK